MLSRQKLPGYRFPLDVIGYAVWLYHRFTLSYRNVEELLLERGICVTREPIRTWCIKFSDQFAQSLRHLDPDGVPDGISTKCIWTSVASNTGYGEPSISTALCWTCVFSATAIRRQPWPSSADSWPSTTSQDSLRS